MLDHKEASPGVNLYVDKVAAVGSEFLAVLGVNLTVAKVALADADFLVVLVDPFAGNPCYNLPSASTVMCMQQLPNV